MCEENIIYNFFTAIDSWNKRRNNVREIPIADVYLNLLYDLGGRLPKSMRNEYQREKITVATLNQILLQLFTERVEYLINNQKISEELIIELLMLSMDKFLDNMLIRLIKSKFDYSDIRFYSWYNQLISLSDQKKLDESKKLWHIIINRKMPIQDRSLVMLNEDKVYIQDSVKTTYDCLALIDT